MLRSADRDSAGLDIAFATVSPSVPAGHQFLRKPRNFTSDLNQMSFFTGKAFQTPKTSWNAVAGLANCNYHVLT
jgi:hypothetical protein